MEIEIPKPPLTTYSQEDAFRASLAYFKNALQMCYNEKQKAPTFFVSA